MSQGAYFRLHANCIPVKGASRSTICDLQRQRHILIPNGLHEILTAHRDSTVDEIKAAYDHQHDDVIDEYFEHLIQQGVGFWCDDPEAFPELSLEWDRPERITNALIDVDDDSTHDYASIFSQLDDLFCKAVQLRFYSPVDADGVSDVLQHSADGRLRSIEVLMPAASWDIPALASLAESYPRLSRIYLYGADETRRMTLNPHNTHLVWHEEVVDGPSCCGQVHPEYFVTHIDVFTEAQEHNSCLNRKVSIDREGEIRNCPSMPLSYGNVDDTSLHSAVMQRDFQELWSINKDQIDVCKDCEFRYVCTDCRAFIEDPDDRYSKPSKCGYDPYTATWSTPEPEHVSSSNGVEPSEDAGA